MSEFQFIPTVSYGDKGHSSTHAKYKRNLFFRDPILFVVKCPVENGKDLIEAVADTVGTALCYSTNW